MRALGSGCVHLVDDAVYCHGPSRRRGWCWGCLAIRLMGCRLLLRLRLRRYHLGRRQRCISCVLICRLIFILDYLVHLSKPVCFQHIHGRIQVAGLATPSGLCCSHLSLAAFVRMEMHPPEVACSIVAFVISFASLACFAICKERLIWGGVDGHPDLPCLFMDTVGMAPQLMLAAEAVGIVGAYRTFESQDSARWSL